jgi:hypothetical protein
MRQFRLHYGPRAIGSLGENGRPVSQRVREIVKIDQNWEIFFSATEMASPTSCGEMHALDAGTMAAMHAAMPCTTSHSAL